MTTVNEKLFKEDCPLAVSHLADTRVLALELPNVNRRNVTIIDGDLAKEDQLMLVATEECAQFSLERMQYLQKNSGGGLLPRHPVKMDLCCGTLLSL